MQCGNKYATRAKDVGPKVQPKKLWDQKCILVFMKLLMFCLVLKVESWKVKEWVELWREVATWRREKGNVACGGRLSGSAPMIVTNFTADLAVGPTHDSGSGPLFYCHVTSSSTTFVLYRHVGPIRISHYTP